METELSTRDHSHEEEIGRQVLAYFVENPAALESVEDIARWRLLKMTVSRTVEETQTALESLAHSGYLERVEIGGGPPLYKLNSLKRADAKRAIEEEDER